ncbi:DUF3592 domain-containing protein [Stieleria varia]|uniref:DUF3592 domain-containing protein n=1 Tax=Stieleria varia TaxID=2528005 RepID=UPI0018D23903|nr:DUF3592 domain-containing protein [Stieleria varia]
MRVPTSARGKQIQCPKCSQKLKIPAGSATSTPAQTAQPLSQSSVPTAIPVAAPLSTPATSFPSQPTTTQDPFADLPTAMPAAPAPGTPMPSAPAPAASGGDFWNELNTPAATGMSPAASFPGGFPSSPAVSSGPQVNHAALAAAGAYSPSLDEKIGNMAAASTGPTERSLGGYFSNRIHWGLIIMMLGGPFLAFIGWSAQSKMAALDARGVTVDGVVLDSRERRSRRSRSYYLEVAYKTEAGAAYTDEFQVNSTYYDSHDLGGTAQVKYDPEDPTQAILVGGSTDSSFLLYLGIGMAIIGLLGVGYTIVVGDIDW